MGNERRDFIRKGLLGASALAIIPRGLRGQTGDCEFISRDFFGLGPFYSAGAPTRQVLAAPEEPGTRIFLDGTVWARDCVTPVSDVLLDIWHADDSGCYSRFENCENPSGDDYKLRGVMRTGASGQFSLESVKPGHYLNGSQFRPAHIHLIVTPPGADDVVTQLYFEGDPYIEIDPAASRPDAAGRIIPFEQKDGALHGTFDIVVDVEPTSSLSEKEETGAARLLQNHPNPVVRGTRIPFELTRPQEIFLAIYDVAGHRVRLLFDGPVEAGRHAIEWDGTDDGGDRLPGGAYICRLEAPGVESTRLITVI